MAASQELSQATTATDPDIPLDPNPEETQETQDAQTPDPTTETFIPPSISKPDLLSGASYTYYSPVPASLLPKDAPPIPVCLGVDEAGRGPVLGPMVYGVFYLPLPLSDPLLRTTHHFDDSKVLTPQVRADLLQKLCTEGSDLHESCGWAVNSLSARDIGAGMFQPGVAYNLNAQAMDATEALIRGVKERGVDVREIYVDTVGPPLTYQKRLERSFPGTRITVAKKADSLYACVSAASVCAKVTRDVACEVMYEHVSARGTKRKAYALQDDSQSAVESQATAVESQEEDIVEESWGSGYPSDVRCPAWMRRNMHPLFGWGPEMRFSWGTAKDMLETVPVSKGGGVKVEWPVDDDDENGRMTDFFVAAGAPGSTGGDELGTWFGTPAEQEAF